MITRTQKAEMINEINNIEKDINLMLFQALGFDVTNGFVISQDTFTNIVFRGRYLKYNSNPNEQLIIHVNDLLFDPINNLKLATDLFARFLYTEGQENNLYVQAYYTTTKGDTTFLTVKKVDRCVVDTIESDCYYNPSYCYIELILKIYGIDCTVKLHRLEELKSYGL